MILACASSCVINSFYDKVISLKKDNRVYLGGELIDCDGMCGGYNLHNAWLTGMKAGKDMANRV